MGSSDFASGSMLWILEILYNSHLDNSSSPVDDVVLHRLIASDRQNGLGDNELGCGLLESSVGVGLVPFRLQEPVPGRKMSSGSRVRSADDSEST